MKNFVLAFVFVFALAVQTASAQRPVISGNLQQQLTGAQLARRVGTVMARPSLTFAQQRLVANGFKQGNAEKDALYISGTATMKDGSKQAIEVDLVGFEKDGEIAVVGSYKMGNETYEAVLQGKRGASLDQFEELEVVPSAKNFQLRKVPGGPNLTDGQALTEGFEFQTPSRRRIRRFLSCLGNELKTSCREQCSAETLRDCAAAGGAVGAMIGGAIGLAAGGVGSIPGAVKGIVVGAVAGLVFCLGAVCGTCTAGQVLECSSSLF
jgi:hypothetical protein